MKTLPQIIPLRLKISNAFIIQGEKLALVDTGSPGDMPAIRKAIDEAGAKIEDLSIIIHTHAHYDHCGCTNRLKQSTMAPTVIHRADLDFLSTGQNATMAPINWFGRLLMPFLKGKFAPVQADIIIEEAFDLRPYGIAGRIIPTAGHTPGSISIWLNSQEAIVGDLFGGGKLLGLFKPGRPRYHHWYSDFDSAKASIAKLLRNSPTRLYVGHGGPLEGAATASFFGNLL